MSKGRVFSSLVVAVALLTLGTSAASARVDLPGDAQAAAARELLRYIPKETRVTCSIREVLPTLRAVAFHVLASVGCQVNKDLYVTYTRFDSADVLPDALSGIVGAGHQFESVDIRSNCESHEEYKRKKKVVGTQQCWRPVQKNADGTTRNSIEIDWSYDSSAILGTAFRDDGNAPKVRAWWKSAAAGPLPKPAKELGAPSKKAERSLLKLFPKDASGNCTPPDGLGGVNDWRVWMTAVVYCLANGSPVQGVTLYRFSDPAALEGAFVHVRDILFPNGPLTGDTPGCNPSKYKVGEAKGFVLCYAGTAEAPQNALVIWTNESLSLLGYANTGTTDLVAVKTWWKKNVDSNA